MVLLLANFATLKMHPSERRRSTAQAQQQQDKRNDDKRGGHITTPARLRSLLANYERTNYPDA
jgi:hypothetical protein